VEQLQPGGASSQSFPLDQLPKHEGCQQDDQQQPAVSKVAVGHLCTFSVARRGEKSFLLTTDGGELWQRQSLAFTISQVYKGSRAVKLPKVAHESPKNQESKVNEQKCWTRRVHQFSYKPRTDKGAGRKDRSKQIQDSC
jgi:hypothetical protein